MHPLLASIPIIGLIIAMTVRMPRLMLPLPAHIALPSAAAAALAIQSLAARDADAILLTARVIEGLLTSLMPLSIVFGAIVLFQTIRASGALDSITTALARSAPDPVMRVVLIAWSFSYLVEGLSGFGTPAALAAPLLVGMGFPPIRAAAACLVMNTVPVVFGAVGMPIWFGLEPAGLTDEEFRAIRLDAALLQCVVAPVIVAWGLALLFPWSELRRRVIPIGVVVMSTVGTSAAVALMSTEFPSIAGGAASLAVAFAVCRFVGRTKTLNCKSPTPPAPSLSIWRSIVPLLFTVALLAATRIEPLGLKGLFNADSPSTSLDLGAAGVVSISASLVTRVDAIMGTSISWTMPLLYVPFIIPFLVVSLASAPVLRLSARETARVWSHSARGMLLPTIALSGALVFVKLMMHGADEAPVVVIGGALADAVVSVHGPLWFGGAPLVGVLGSFFSGSATISNLTFSTVQAQIADGLSLSQTRVLALQSIGAAIGNMACIHNIVAVVAVLGLSQNRRKARGNGTLTNRRKDDCVTDPVSSILRHNLKPLGVAAIATILAGVAIPETQIR